MIRYILTDIEGTTTDISFVKNVLFPYSLENIENFILQNDNNQLLINDIKAVIDTIYLEQKIPSSSIKEVIEQLKNWIFEDRKHPALKSIQGMIWDFGYKNDGLKAHIYSDVHPSLQSWKNSGITLGLYSSGSIQAQKLLFENTIEGDLIHLFSNFFDTSIGHKRETSSFLNIRKVLNIPSNQILFLSDIEEELDAANEVGFKTCQLVRDNIIPSKKYKTALNFFDVSKLFIAN